MKSMQPEVPYGLITVSCGTLNAELCTRGRGVATQILSFIAKGVILRNVKICKTFASIMTGINRKPADSVDLVEIEGYVRNVRDGLMDQLFMNVEDVRERLQFLFHHKAIVTSDVLRPIGATFAWTKKNWSDTYRRRDKT